MTRQADPLDVLQLAEQREGVKLRFGPVDVGHAVGQAMAHEALNERSTANLELKLRLLAGQPVDYLSTVTMAGTGLQEGKPQFTGNVLTAEPDASVVRLNAETAPELTERRFGYLDVKNAVGPELIHLAVRSAGFPEDRINIEGLDEMLPIEAIEVVVPVRGVRVEEAVDLGPLRLLPPRDAAAAVDEFNPSDARDRFKSADAYLVGLEVARRLFDAECEVLTQADELLAWLTVRARYGLALLPNGRPQTFSRVIARARPRRGDLVLVRGLGSGRRWFRAVTGEDEEVDLTLDFSDSTWVAPPREYSLQDRQALLACARAGHTTDPLERIQALWEAVEFHVAGIQAPQLFDREEVKRLRKSLPKDIDQELRERAQQLLGKVNEPPLLAKLREAVRRDGVPMAEGDFELLSRLRTARNDAVHGRTPDLPLREDVDHAVSIVARMLVYRLQRLRAGTPSTRARTRSS